jgi:aromatase
MTEHGRQVRHEITASVPAAEVYRLIADVRNWPRIFPPTILVDHLERGDERERIRIWATANGSAKTWTSRRILDPANLRIDFRQEVSADPVAEMSGSWILESLGDAACRIVLLHEYRAVDDDPSALAWIDAAVDRNSRSELAALRTTVEGHRATDERTFSFTDTVRMRGSVKDAYGFINEAGLWPERLPHVATVRFEEVSPGLQSLERDTRARDGSTHTTKSYRVCLPFERIAYKQVTLPALMSLHTGTWTFQEHADDDISVSSEHTVTIDTGNIARVLGAGAGLPEARSYVQGALSTNSLATLHHAAEYVREAR